MWIPPLAETALYYKLPKAYFYWKSGRFLLLFFQDFGFNFREIVGDFCGDLVVEIQLLGNGDRFDAENDDLVGTGVDFFGQLDDLEDVDFVQGQVGHLLDAVDVVGGEAAEGAGFCAHEAAVDEDGFFAFGNGVQQVHAAAAAVVVFDIL